MTHSQRYFEQAAEIARLIDHEAVERIVADLVRLRERGGRLFLLGVGGSAANCSPRRQRLPQELAGIEAYTPVDNVAELTARTNDEGWDTIFAAWLVTSKAGERDAVLVLSVGGGNLERNVSVNVDCPIPCRR